MVTSWPATASFSARLGAMKYGVGIQDHDALADRLFALEHLFRRELIGLRGVGARNRVMAQAIRAVRIPRGAGGDDDFLRAVSERRLGRHGLLTQRHLALLVLLHELVDLQFPVIAVVAPFAESG